MNRLTIDADLGTQQISKHIYGHFSEHLGHCIYGGYWVGEDSPIANTRRIRNDVVEALKGIAVPNMRWPGGCFADEYHWMEGIGPREERPGMVNTHWGGVTEDNSFGTHEFMELCAQLDCEAYICGNLGSGTVREMQQWVEYLNADNGPMAELRAKNGREEPWGVRLWGVGNENWGCGGSMRPEYYADEYRRYATYCRNFGDAQLYKVACGPSGGDYHWTEVMMREAAQRMHGLALHYYCGSGKNSRSATEFDEEDWFWQLKNALQIEELIVRHSAIMDQYDPEKRVGLLVDEWGAWHAVEPDTNPGFLYQQNSLRDGLVAGLSLNIFNRYCERVYGANIAQTVNVLQAMVLTEDGGERMLLTPTYHVFEMFKGHQDATLLPVDLRSGTYAFGEESTPALNVSASKSDDGKILVTVCNLDPNGEQLLNCDIRGVELKEVSGRVLTAPEITAHNTFDEPDQVRPVEFMDAELNGSELTVRVPGKSVVAVELT